MARRTLRGREGDATGDGQTFAGGTPSLLRAINERTVLEHIRQAGPVSRAQIARDTGLSKPTVSQALAALERARLVRETGRTSGGKGPTAVIYALNPRAGAVVGLDVGHDWVRAAIADLTGEIVARRDERTKRSAAALVAQLGEIAHGLADEASIRWKHVTYAVVGSPGVLQSSSDRVALAPNLPGWEKPGLVDALTAELGTQLHVENDVNLAAIGEAWRGLGKGVDDLVYLHVGTGVGMGLILRGELFRGAHGAAGEVGYLPIGGPDPQSETSRRRGALEASLGAAGVVAAGKAAGMGGSLTPKRIFAAARRGDERALEVVGVVAERIAMTIATIVPVVDPELVILGGGIGGNGDLLLDPVERALAAISPFHPRLEAGALGDDAVLVGAVSSALDRAQEQLFSRAEGRGAIVV